MLGKQAECVAKTRKIGLCLSHAPFANRVVPDFSQIGLGQRAQDNRSRHAPRRAAKKAVMSKGRAGPLARPCSANACIASRARARS